MQRVYLLQKFICCAEALLTELRRIYLALKMEA